MRTRVLLAAASLCLLATPASALSPPGVTVQFHEETLDHILDETGVFDPMLGHSGACVRSSAVEAAKDIYGNEDGEDHVEPCGAGQCIAPPNLYINTDSCWQALEKIILDAEATVWGLIGGELSLNKGS